MFVLLLSFHFLSLLPFKSPYTLLMPLHESHKNDSFPSQMALSQKDLADILNITDKAISKWERGISFPDISMLIPLSETLEISLYDLLSGGDYNGKK